MKKYLTILFASLLLILGGCLTASAAEFTVTDTTAAVTEAPENSEMIVALYSGETLTGLRVYNGSGSITGNYAEDMPEVLEHADRIKIFLWELSTLYPHEDRFEAELEELPSESDESNALIVYFSATGNTEALANTIANVTGADMYEIIPEDQYTDEDLNYSDDDCRANQEMNDPNARPAISGTIENMDEYDTILLGYPIWWGRLPKIMYTFTDMYDLAGKTIIPFCTSGSSGISTSVSELRSICVDSNVTDGFRGTSSSSERQVRTWLEENGFFEQDGDGRALVSRIESRNGLHTLEHAEEIGLGSREYELISIDV